MSHHLPDVALPVASVLGIAISCPHMSQHFPSPNTYFLLSNVFFYFPVAYSYRSSLFRISFCFSVALFKKESRKRGFKMVPLLGRRFLPVALTQLVATTRMSQLNATTRGSNGVAWGLADSPNLPTILGSK